MTTELQAAAVELQHGQSLELIDCASKMHMSVMCLGCELPSDVHRDVIILWLKVRDYIGSLEDENMRLRSAYLGGKVNTDIKLTGSKK